MSALGTAAFKTLGTQLVKRGLPAAAKAAGLPSEAERALEQALRDAVRDAVRQVCPQQPAERQDHLAHLLAETPVSEDAVALLLETVNDPGLPDAAGSSAPLPALRLRFSASLGAAFDWSTAGIDPEALDEALGRSVLTGLRAVSVRQPLLAPLTHSLELGLRFNELHARMSAEFRDLRAELGRVVEPAPQQVKAPLPPSVQAALDHAGAPARGILAGILNGPPADRGTRLAELVAAPPQWLSDADGFTWLAIARCLPLYGLHGAASRAAEQAASTGGGPRSALLAVAAVNALRDDDHARARELCAAALAVDAASAEASAVSAFLDDDPAAALAATEAWHLGDDTMEMLVSVRAWALLASTPPRHDEAVRLFEAAAELRPTDHVLLMRLAEAETQAAEALPDEGRSRRDRARRHALDARTLLQSWQVPAPGAAFLAARAAMLNHDRLEALRILRPAPHGDATAPEAANERCRSLAAINLALVGDVDGATELRDALPQGRPRWEASIALSGAAELRGARDQDALDRLRELYLLLLVTATSDGERLSAEIGLADTGEVPLAELEWVKANHPAMEAELHARAALAVNDPQTAIKAFGGIVSERQAVLVADAYARLGELTRAGEVLADTARRLDAPHLLTSKVYLFADAVHIETDAWDRLTEASAATFTLAEVAISDALSAAPHGPDAPSVLRLQAQLAHRAGDWRRCTTAARAALERAPDGGVDPQWTLTRWRLVMSLFNLREEEQAWRAVRQPVPLTPESPDQAKVVLLLATFCADARTLALEASELAKRFAADPAFRNWLATFMLLVVDARLREQGLIDDERPTHDVPLAEAEESIRDVVHAVASDETSDAPWRSVSLPDDPDEMFATVTKILQEAHEGRTALADALDRGLPIGALVHQNYAYALLTVAGGVLRIEAPDPAFREQELAHARECAAATRPDLSVDLSAAHTMTLKPQWSSLLRAHAGRLLITDQAVAVAHDARLQFLSAPAATSSLDPYGNAIFHEADPDDVRVLRDRAAALAGLTKTFDALPHPGPLDDDPARRSILGAWSDSLAVARARGCALLSDDAGQRKLARALQIPAFSSAALAAALHERGQPELVPLLTSTWRSLGPTDVPTTRDDLTDLAANHGYTAGVASWPWTRPITWISLSAPVTDAVDLLNSVLRNHPDGLAQWMHDITLGLLTAGGDVAAVTSIMHGAADGAAIADPRTSGALLVGAHAACTAKSCGDDLLRAVIKDTRRRNGGKAEPGVLVHYANLPPPIASRVLALEH